MKRTGKKLTYTQQVWSRKMWDANEEINRDYKRKKMRIVRADVEISDTSMQT